MKIRLLWRQLIIVMLFLMTWATGYLIPVKILLCMLIFGLGVIISIHESGLIVSKSVLRWFGIFIICNLFFTALSILYNNQGALLYLNVDIVEPILFFGIICVITKMDFEKLKYVFIYSSTFLLVYMILGFYSVNGFLPINLPFIIKDYGGLLPFGLMKADAEFMQWLYFLIPGNILLFFFRETLEKRRIIVLNFALSLIVGLISLKTAMLLVVAFSMIVSFLLHIHYTKGLHVSANKLIISFLVVIVLVFAWFYFDLASIFQNYILKKIMISFGQASYTNSFGVIDNGGALRVGQINALLDTWKEKPFLGWGVGADAKGMIRSEVHGAYEMTYFAKLMQRGIIGMTIYVLQIAWMLKNLLKNAKSNIFRIESLYLFVALSAMLIANGTNPYIEAFDKLIILFLPLLIINLVDKKKKE